jgi:hypothetical protein
LAFPGTWIWAALPGLFKSSKLFRRTKKMQKKGLYIGIDNYEELTSLSGCVNDANSMHNILKRNGDESPNLQGKVISSDTRDTRHGAIVKEVIEFFKRPADLALFYFSGHGTSNELDAYLATSDATASMPGFSMTGLLRLANQSPIREIVIIIDCCHSGEMGDIPHFGKNISMLREGISILTASRPTERAFEVSGGGVFTRLMLDALNGGTDGVGGVTVASLYSYVDQALGAFQQRPMFKTNVSRLFPLRQAGESMNRELIRMLPVYFPSVDFFFRLDPTFEPTSELGNPNNIKVFANLQKMRDARFLVPFGEHHLYFAAIQSKGCVLTQIGKYYWQLAKDDRI